MVWRGTATETLLSRADERSSERREVRSQARKKLPGKDVQEVPRLSFEIVRVGVVTFLLETTCHQLPQIKSRLYLKTNSLRWPILSHFLADLGNLSIFVFLNMIAA
jgi:hypothetical protein